ncbi:MAG TPA: hypothetical protein VGL95_09005 [Acetobacteraceae bacterium]
MPATRRSSRFPRAAILIPLLAALGGCVAALPLLQLGAATPMPQAAPCAQNTRGTPDGTTPACNAGTTGSTMPGMATFMQVLAPATAQSR